jgi:hypothetical protein
VPRFSGWSVGAVIFAGVLWCVLAYFFFVHGRFTKRAANTSKTGEAITSG